VLEPGDLDALGGAGRAAWSEKVRRIVGDAAKPEGHLVLAADLEHVLATEWPGLPSRVTRCLGRDVALELLDRRGDHGDAGRRALQEEYLEWRVVRDGEGRIERLEFTTELAAYWRTFASHEPEALLETVASFAGASRVDPSHVFGTCDPFDSSPEERESAFAATMIDPTGARSPYNSGARAICCLVQPTNTLTGLAKLTAAASVPHAYEDAPCLRAGDVLARLDSGIGARSSDPLLVERLARLAWDGRIVAFDDPIGLYLHGVQHARLRTPGGDIVPAEWFALSRGGPAVDGRARHQRAVFEVPPGEGLCVSDLIDVVTEEPIRYGGQIADLLQVALYVRVSGTGARPPKAVRAAPAARGDVCTDVAAAASQLEAA